MLSRRGKRRSDLGRGVRDREREHGVEEEAARGDGDDQECERDQDWPANDVKRLAVQHVQLQIEHRQPDPHGWKQRDQSEAPVSDDQLQGVEQNRDRADRKGKWREYLARAAQAENRLLDLRLVAVLYRPEERPDASDEPPETVF